MSLDPVRLTPMKTVASHGKVNFSESITTVKRFHLCLDTPKNTSCLRPSHKYHVKSPKYLSENSQKFSQISQIIFFNISKNPLNIFVYFVLKINFCNQRGQNFHLWKLNDYAGELYTSISWK